jgi:hypothetical protein
VIGRDRRDLASSADDVVVIDEAEGRHLAGPMASGAVRPQDRGDVFIERNRRRCVSGGRNREWNNRCKEHAPLQRY